MPLRVGIVGCGAIAQAVHIPILTQLPGVQVAALAEPDPEQRRRAQQLSSTATGFESAGALIAQATLDAVVICSPTACHAEHALAAVERGLHVYLEKPLAASLADGVALRDAWRRSGVIGMVGFNYRCNELICRLKEQLRLGRGGPVVAARTTFCAGPGELPAWKQRRESGGGALLDLGSHHVDLLPFLLGQKIRAVRATLWSRRTEDDCALLELELDGGIRVQSLFAFDAAAADRIEIQGERGTLVVERSRSWDAEFSPGSAEGGLLRIPRWLKVIGRIRYPVEKLRSPLHEPSYRLALARFVAAIRGTAESTPSFEDGLACLAVLEAAEESARLDKRVDICDIQRRSQMRESYRGA